MRIESLTACGALRTQHPKLYAVALAIQEHEGFIPAIGPKPPSRSWRNNNPGNLRKSVLADREEDGFAVFADYYTGFLALLLDLASKALGHTRTNLRPHSTLQDLITTWAPPSENDTQRYIDYVTKRTGLAADTALRELLWG